MNAFIILIILTSGFFFTSSYPLARFKQIRATGWALYLHSFSWGLPFAFSGMIITSILEEVWPALFVFLSQFSLIGVFDTNGASVVIWTVITLLQPWAIGVYLRRYGNFHKAIEKSAAENDFKAMLYKVTNNGYAVQVSLSSGKVYIGYLFTINNEDMLKNAEYMSLWLILSGYRDEKTKCLKITNNYKSQYKKLLEGKNEDQNDSLVKIIMNKGNIEDKTYH